MKLEVEKNRFITNVLGMFKETFPNMKYTLSNPKDDTGENQYASITCKFDQIKLCFTAILKPKYSKVIISIYSKSRRDAYIFKISLDIYDLINKIINITSMNIDDEVKYNNYIIILKKHWMIYGK